MDVLQEIIYEQNLEILQLIANDKYNDDEDKKKFIQKYHKKNYSCMKIIKKNNIQEYEKKINKLKK